MAPNETTLELLKRLAERLRQKTRLARAHTGYTVIVRLAITVVSMMVGFASLRTVLLATVERHIAFSVATTVVAFVSGAAISIGTRWKRNRRERKGHRLSSEVKQVYRDAILAGGLIGGSGHE